MSVVIDEVVTQIEDPPREEQRETPAPAQNNPAMEKRKWEQSQAAFWQRQQRISAD